MYAIYFNFSTAFKRNLNKLEFKRKKIYNIIKTTYTLIKLWPGKDVNIQSHLLWAK